MTLTYAIYDEKGRIVKEGIVHNENVNIALNVAKGMYYLQSTVNGEEGTLKFLIAK